MQTRELLAAVKAVQGIGSDYRLARFLGVTDNTVANWKHGRSRPDDAMAVRLAELAQLDPGPILARLAAERATDAGASAAWRRVADQLARSLVALLVALGIGGGPDGHAGQVDAPTAGVKIMSTRCLHLTCKHVARLAAELRAALLRAGGWFRAFAPSPAGLAPAI